MASVYLPFGYPEISGQVFELLVYQGTLCRYYPDATDPRTEAQLWQRQINSDMSKTRATLGDWGKGSLRGALGSHWPTVLFQLIKADTGGWWSGALDEWNAFSAGEQANWQAVNPYQATFNSPGMVFYCLQRVMYQALVFFSSWEWGADEWGLGDSAAALAWWQKDLQGAMKKGLYQDTSLLIDYEGGFLWNDVGASGGTWHDFRASPGKARFYVYGSRILIQYVKRDYGGNVAVMANMEQVATYNCDQYPTAFGFTIYAYFPKRGFYLVELVVDGDHYGTLDQIEVY